MMDLYIQVIMALAAVVGLIFVMSFFLRKRQSKQGIMNVISYQSLGPKKAIVALDIGKEILLVGITQADLKLLKTYEKSDFESEPIKEMNDKLVKLRNIKAGLYESK